MRIVECIASRTGTFKNREITFSPGMNVIYGANDSGKTLLALSLIDLIFGTFDTHFTGDTNLWNGYFLSAKCNTGGREWIISRNAHSSISMSIPDAVLPQTYESEKPDSHSPNDLFESAGPRDFEIIHLLQKYPRSLFAEVGLLNSPLLGSGPLDYRILRSFFT
ncbi:MAG TPA: AAA family ATPase, partial [Spirochaetota bacterium]